MILIMALIRITTIFTTLGIPFPKKYLLHGSSGAQAGWTFWRASSTHHFQHPSHICLKLCQANHPQIFQSHIYSIVYLVVTTHL
ncbi:hypothetical protein CPB84DRAFT_713318 [Gymnopilus junonius]|uniref:Secreted protein n=1 Tax=Gymnopilus junonius TaxID=109634 RepID=A0A9P5NSP0_GYMJU|nr:hypothetical protein CPB84DRAFT_713318 [Gymnopilus junonius]